jgi:phosphohistidine phosphatase SixA
MNLITKIPALLILIGVIGCGDVSTQSTAAPSNIWSRLQQKDKSYVVLMRHALAPGIGDPANFRLKDCTTQRNLSSEGRSQAVRTGKAFRSRKIPVIRVLSSQWCRCLETAKLLNLGTPKAFPTLNSFFDNYKTQRQQTDQLRKYILNNRQTKGVILMVTHQVNITELIGAIPESGASVVLQVNPQGRIEIVGEIPPL